MTPARWGWIALLLIAPLQIGSVCFSGWLLRPPKVTGDGPDYEAIGYQLSIGNGWSTHYSDPGWRSVYEQSATQRPLSTGKDSGDAEALQPADATSRTNDPAAKSGINAFGPLAPDTNRPPLFPLAIGFIYQLIPRGPVAFAAVRICNALFLAAACAFTVAWGLKLLQRSKLQAVPNGSLIFACSIIGIVYSERNLRNYLTDFLTEPMAACFAMVFIAAAWHAVVSHRQVWIVVSALLFALMYFARSSFFLWLPGISVWLLICCYATGAAVEDSSFKERVEPLRMIAIFLIVFGLTASPWWIRNCSVLHEFSPLGTKGYTSFLGGFCDEAYAASGEWQFAPERALRLEKTADENWGSVSAERVIEVEKEIASESKRRILQWCWENPGRLSQLTFLRVVTEWNPYTGKALILKLLALVGIVWLARNQREILLWVAGPLVVSTVTVALTYSVGGRFLVPTYGCIYILAAFGILAIYQSVISRLMLRGSVV